MMTGDLFCGDPGLRIGATRHRRIETPAARASDPWTSHAAAEDVTASGKRAHQQAQAIAAVRAFPGHTSAELATLTCGSTPVHEWRYALARRLPECVTAGAILKGEAKHCSVTGRAALTWFPASN